MLSRSGAGKRYVEANFQDINGRSQIGSDIASLANHRFPMIGADFPTFHLNICLPFTICTNWGSIATSHRQMLERFLDLCPEGGALLDAACGTGKYWPILLARGFSVHGTDQSLQMLRQAQTKCPEVPVEHVGMQELSFVDTFDGIICIDAMEMVFPEDWPFDLRNFARALHEHGFLYFTVEMTTQEEVDLAYEAG